MIETGGGAVFAGDVTAGGDVVGRDQLEAQGERSVVTGDRGSRAVLVGDAGSGKSTFVDYLAYRLADGLVSGEQSAVPPSLRGLLPIRPGNRHRGAGLPG
jgi:ATP-dependent Clp protease ATP-binding subunit ClpA